MLTDLVAAMPARLSSLTCDRYRGKPIFGKPTLIAFLDIWDDEIAEQIGEIVGRLMTGPYALHVRGLTVVGEPRGCTDYSRWRCGDCEAP